MGIPFKDDLEKAAAEAGDTFEQIHERVWKKAYEIINRKRATFYGVGAALAEITKAILRDERKVFATGAYLSGEYGEEGVYAGIPSVLGREGIIKTYEFPLSDAEKEQFKKSVSTLKEVTEKALKVIA
jgi:L-lactate dehydrogenase